MLLTNAAATHHMRASGMLLHRMLCKYSSHAPQSACMTLQRNLRHRRTSLILKARVGIYILIQSNII